MNVGRQSASDNSSILELKAVSKAFGGVQALLDISFDVPRGVVQGLIGPNGAGKTTLFNLITGIFAPDSGRIVFDQRPTKGKKAHQLAARGIARTFQNVELFESMTVIENVLVGQYVRTRCGFWGAISRTPAVVREEREARQKAMQILSFIGLDQFAERPSSDLAFGWQRLLEIGRALASEPHLLLLDEPAAGLNAVETRQLGQLIKKIQAQGITLLLVEHDMSLTMTVSDRIVVLDQGRLLASGTPREIQSDEAVMAAYLGRAR